jgi:hypothetical protein
LLICDILTCYDSIIYKICVKTQLYLDNTVKKITAWIQFTHIHTHTHIYIYIYIIYIIIYILKVFGTTASSTSVEEHMASTILGWAIRWWGGPPKFLLIQYPPKKVNHKEHVRSLQVYQLCKQSSCHVIFKLYSIKIFH